MNLKYRMIIVICYFFIIAVFLLPTYDSISLDFFSCNEINCSFALVELLEEMPDHYCAFYDLEDDVIYGSINEGVLFEDNYEEQYSKLQSVSSKGLMHHKYCVFDEKYVFTGSWNPTQRGTNVNDNYILFIDSKKIAKVFLDEYVHLQNRDESVSPLFVLSKNHSVNVYFCPQHNCQDKVLNELKKAKRSVKILAFTFTDEEIAEELLFLSRKGVDIEIIYEKTRITRYSTIHDFSNSAIKTFRDSNPYTMHEKMIVIDEEISILGSYNPTKGATLRNDENILIIKNKELAQSALNEYYRVFSFITK